MLAAKAISLQTFIMTLSETIDKVLVINQCFKLWQKKSVLCQEFLLIAYLFYPCGPGVRIGLPSSLLAVFVSCYGTKSSCVYQPLFSRKTLLLCQIYTFKYTCVTYTVYLRRKEVHSVNNMIYVHISLVAVMLTFIETYSSVTVKMRQRDGGTRITLGIRNT